MASNLKTALVLTGGGARAAYQVGVLLAVSKLSNNRRRNPFPILCGTSAGAINVTSIRACLADNFSKAVSVLATFWRNMHAEHIYRADAIAIGLSASRWLSAMTAALLEWETIDAEQIADIMAGKPPRPPKPSSQPPKAPVDSSPGAAPTAAAPA